MAEVAVLGAVGYAGAIAAQLLHRHPAFELTHVTARAESGQRLDDVHPRTRVPLELEVFDSARHAVDAADVRSAGIQNARSWRIAGNDVRSS